MNKSFFGELQGWIKKEYGTDYGGRYLSLLIEHTHRADPLPFRKFLARIFGSRFPEEDVVIVREHLFRGSKGFRRADLAVLVGNQVRALVELKYRDRLMAVSSTQPAQLADYLDYCCSNKECRFLLLYREPQPPHDIAAIQQARQISCHYTALAPYLRGSRHPSSALLYQYLQEEGLMLEPIDADQLYRFLHRLLLPWGGAGRINTKRVAEGPRQFQTVLNNMRLFAADVTPLLLRATGKESARSATVDFSISERLSKRDLARAMEKASRERYLEIDASDRRGGEVSVWAQNAFAETHNAWLYVNYGFTFSLRPDKQLSVEQYADLSSPEINRRPTGYSVEPIRISRLANPEKASSDLLFIRLIRHAAKAELRRGVVKEKFSLKVLHQLAAL